MSLDVCLQNIEKVGKKFVVANRPSDVVSRIHVYVHLVACFKSHINVYNFTIVSLFYTFTTHCFTLL